MGGCSADLYFANCAGYNRFFAVYSLVASLFHLTGSAPAVRAFALSVVESSSFARSSAFRSEWN